MFSQEALLSRMQNRDRKTEYKTSQAFAAPVPGILLLCQPQLVLYLLPGGGVLGGLEGGTVGHQLGPGLTLVEQADQHHRHVVTAQPAHLTVRGQASVKENNNSQGRIQDFFLGGGLAGSGGSVDILNTGIIELYRYNTKHC